MQCSRSKKKQLEGGVTSLALRGAGHQFFVGTGKSQLYRFTYADFAAELLYTCHNSAITDAVFPVYAIIFDLFSILHSTFKT